MSCISLPADALKNLNGSEKRMNLPKISIVLLTLLLAAMAIVPCVSAEEQKNIKIITSDVALIKPLIGQDITIGEYYENVSPEVLKDMPSSLREELFQTKMEWPKPLSEAESKSMEKNSKLGVVTTYSGIYGALSESGLNPVVGNTLIYGSQTFTDPSGTLFPFLADTSTLMKWNANINQWDPVVSKTSSGFLRSFNSASGNYVATSGIYTSFGTHSGTFPLGCIPMQYVQFTQGPVLSVY
jgi:hypothetical protein